MTKQQKIKECYVKLNGHFPNQLVYIWYKGLRISQADFFRSKYVHV